MLDSGSSSTGAITSRSKNEKSGSRFLRLPPSGRSGSSPAGGVVEAGAGDGDGDGLADPGEDGLGDGPGDGDVLGDPGGEDGAGDGDGLGFLLGLGELLDELLGTPLLDGADGELDGAGDSTGDSSRPLDTSLSASLYVVVTSRSGALAEPLTSILSLGELAEVGVTGAGLSTGWLPTSL